MREKLKNNHKKSAMALLSVVLMSALLITLYLRFTADAGLYARIDSRQEVISENRWAARAGLDFAIALLSEQQGVALSYSDDWKTLSEDTLTSPIIINNSSCSVQIFDESAKANINKVTERFLTSVFTHYDLGISTSFSIINEESDIAGAARLAQRILDYIDSDDVPRALGAESSFYIEQGYLPPKNAPMEDIRELLNIPGITNDIFVASGTRLGLQDLLTVHGEGIVNINTASEGVVRAFAGLPQEYDYDKKEEYYTRLFNERPFLGSAGFRNFIVDFDWKIQKSYTKNFITSTSWFKIVVQAQTFKTSSFIEAILFRDIYGECKILRLTEIP